MIDFYELLGIKKSSSKEEIKEAYRKMVKKYHPDVNKSEEANKIIISLNEAKEVLLDDEKRVHYDEMLNSIERSKQFSNDKRKLIVKKQENIKKHMQTFMLRNGSFFSII